MPGIVGLISPRPPAECRRLVERMIRSMLHEKSYSSGTYSQPGLGVYAGWVVHEGSFADCQPIVGERGDVALVFAGECFPGHPDPRDRLRQGGHAFAPNRAEWLIHLYEDRSDRFFADLNGVFSGLLVDERRRLAFLFNDRYGMERIYYHESPHGLFFASEAKALLAVLPEMRAFDDRGLAQMLAFGCTLEWRSLFRGIGILPGGSLWRFQGSSCSKEKYFEPGVWESQPSLSPEAFENELGETLRRVVPHYFESDFGVGISLTGGLDTRMIMACRPRHENPVCYTFGGQEGDTLDVRLARRVASVSALQHDVLRIGRDFFSDFGALVDRTVYITDGCLGVTGAHEIYLNRQARELAPIRLTGNFGGEILRGATTFKPLHVSPDLVDPGLCRRVSEERTRLTEMSGHAQSFAAFCEIPWSLFGVPRAAQSVLTTRTPYLDNDLVALAFRSPPLLRRSAGSALKVVRESTRGLEGIPTDGGRIPARPGLPSAARALWHRLSFKVDYWCNSGLPGRLSVMGTPVGWLGQRAGFAGLHRYLHYRQWFGRELSVYLRDQLAIARDHGGGFWNRQALHRLLKRHATQPGPIDDIAAIMNLGAIGRLLLSEVGTTADA